MSMTTSPSTVDRSSFTVRRTIRIAAPVTSVWSAVTEPEHISKWFGVAVFDGAGVGAGGTLTFPDYGAVPLRIEAIDPPRAISYRWGNDDASGEMAETSTPSTPRCSRSRSRPSPAARELTVVETGFENDIRPGGQPGVPP